MHLPAAYEYPNATYFAEYLNFESHENLFEILDSQTQQVLTTYEALSENQALFSYKAGKWSLKQILGHIVDTERVFSYRTFAISRNEKQALLSFDENDYLTNAQYESQNLREIILQYSHTRKATISLLQSFNLTQWNQVGIANAHSISARALAWMIAGHEKHHLKIISERYLAHFRNL